EARAVWIRVDSKSKVPQRDLSTRPMAIGQAGINLTVAFVLSAAIGFERQWRNRLAGLRTNTLVALGRPALSCLQHWFRARRVRPVSRRKSYRGSAFLERD